MARGYKQLKSDVMPLEDAFGFDEEALTLNRRGQLSDEQRALLATVGGSSKIWTWIAAVAILGSIGVLAAIVLSQTDGQSEPVIAVGVVAGIAVALFVAAVVRGWWAKRDFRAQRVTTVEGPIRRKVKRNHDGLIERYILRVGRTKLLLSSRDQLESFNDDGHYVVHMIRYPGTPIILSAARVR